MSGLVGFKARTYRDTAGNWASPTWSNMGGIRDNTLNGTKSQIEATDRDSGDFMEWLAGHIDAGIDGSYRPKRTGTSDPHLDALIDSWQNHTPILLAVMSDDITTVGAKGLKAWCQVFNFTRSEPIDGAVEYTYSIKPTKDNGGNAPAWITIT